MKTRTKVNLTLAACVLAVLFTNAFITVALVDRSLDKRLGELERQVTEHVSQEVEDLPAPSVTDLDGLSPLLGRLGHPHVRSPQPPPERPAREREAPERRRERQPSSTERRTDHEPPAPDPSDTRGKSGKVKKPKVRGCFLSADLLIAKACVS